MKIEVNGTKPQLYYYYIVLLFLQSFGWDPMRVSCKEAGRKAAMAYSSSGGGVGASLKQITTNTVSSARQTSQLNNTGLSTAALLWHMHTCTSHWGPICPISTFCSFPFPDPKQSHPSPPPPPLRYIIAPVPLPSSPVRYARACGPLENQNRDDEFKQLNENRDENIFTRDNASRQSLHRKRLHAFRASASYYDSLLVLFELRVFRVIFLFVSLLNV